MRLFVIGQYTAGKEGEATTKDYSNRTGLYYLADSQRGEGPARDAGPNRRLLEVRGSEAGKRGGLFVRLFVIGRYRPEALLMRKGLLRLVLYQRRWSVSSQLRFMA